MVGHLVLCLCVAQNPEINFILGKDSGFPQLIGKGIIASPNSIQQCLNHIFKQMAVFFLLNFLVPLDIVKKTNKSCADFKRRRKKWEEWSLSELGEVGAVWSQCSLLFCFSFETKTT